MTNTHFTFVVFVTIFLPFTILVVVDVTTLNFCCVGGGAAVRVTVFCVTVFVFFFFFEPNKKQSMPAPTWFKPELMSFSTEFTLLLTSLAALFTSALIPAAVLVAVLVTTVLRTTACFLRILFSVTVPKVLDFKYLTLYFPFPYDLIILAANQFPKCCARDFGFLYRQQRQQKESWDFKAQHGTTTIHTYM